VSSDHWRQVEDLYTRVAGLDATERSRLLDQQRADAPQVVAEVESLVAAEPPGEQFLSTPWVSGGSPVEATPSLTGRSVGAFRLIEIIGTGGMGVVYRAEREDAGFAQQVAIKVVTAARWHRASLKQLTAERQLLAALHHPHIVTLIDGGLTDDGHAYLVMEYVEGLPITAWCRERHVDVATRLRLFQQICSAVQYAHRHSIVHRDLKPGNILVTPDGVPKILDFGIARLLTEPAEGRHQTTAGWFRALTPNYASPEQMRGLPASAADDVYALGVLLFELLTGRVPYDTAGKPLDEVLRTVVEQPAPRPSAVVGTSSRWARPSELRGDVDAIVLKAIDKEPARRYGSAQELADDIGRHLAGQGVVAREPSFAYVLATLARRHRALVAASVVSVVAVLAALGVSVVQTRRAVAERDRADQRFSDVRRLANTLIFDIHDAVQPLAGSTPVREKIVAEALKYLEVLAKGTEDDALRLELGAAYHRIGTVQGNPSGPNLGDRTGAVNSFRRAIALLAPTAARSRDAAFELTRAQFSLAATLSALGQPEEAVRAAREAQGIAERLFAGDARDAAARRLLGTAYFWQATLAPVGSGEGQSIPMWVKAGEVFESLLADGPDDPDRQRNVALVAKYLGEQYRKIGAVDNALAQHRRAQEIDAQRVARTPGNRQAQLDLALDWSSLGGLYREQGQLREAAVSFERSLAARQRLAASDPDDDYTRGRLAHAHAILGGAYGDLNRLPEALSHLREAVRLSESRHQPDLEGRIDLAQQLVDLSRVETMAGLGSRACGHLVQASRVGIADTTASGSLEGNRQSTAAAITAGLASCRAPGTSGRG